MKKRLLLLAFFPLATAQAQLWQNDFSAPSDWISSDLNSGSDQWVISSSAIGGDVDSINSLSAGNGFAQFNSENQCSGNHQDVVLTYFQTIDISANELSYLEFVQHYKRKTDSVFVEFSADGLTWESVLINQEYWFYQQTANPDTVRVSIPATIHASPFYLRFRYSGECGYAWLIDDLKIFEKQQFAAITETRIMINGRNYQKANHCVMDTLDYRVFISNFGYDTLNDVVVEYSVYKQGLLQNMYQDTIEAMLPLETLDTTFYAVHVPGGAIDADYSVEGKIYSIYLDTLYHTNFVEGTSDDLRKDDGVVEGAFLTTSSVWGLGQTFVAKEEYCSSQAEVFIPSSMPDGEVVYLLWYRLVDGQWVYNGMSEDVVLNTTPAGYWAYFGSWFEDVFFVGDTGLVVFRSYGSELPIAYAQKAVEDDVYAIDENLNISHLPGGHSLLIQLNTGYFDWCNCFIGLNEDKQGELVVFPNPTSSEIQIKHSTSPVKSIRIRSIEGREVYADFMPVSETILTSFLETGTYFVVVETMDNRIYTEKMVKL